MSSMMSMETNMAEKNPKKGLGKRVASSIFGTRKAEELGGSWWVPTGVLLAYRVLAVAAFTGIGSMALRRRLWAGVPAPAVGAILAGVLASFSALHALRRDFQKLGRVIGPLYQIAASVALFLAPIAATLHVVDPTVFAADKSDVAKKMLAKAVYERNIVTAANLLPAAVFLADSLLLGGQVQFSFALAPVPAVLECLVALVPVGKAAWRRGHLKVPQVKVPGMAADPPANGTVVGGALGNVTAAGEQTMTKGKPHGRPLILIVLMALGVAIVSALVAVGVTRIPKCWAGRAKKKEMEEDGDADIEEIPASPADLVQPPERAHETKVGDDSHV